MRPTPDKIPRHKTAMFRTKASSPILWAIENNIINCHDTILDFGSGRGYDVHYLKTLGYDVSGYDPYYSADVPLKNVDIVFLNYVLNVIEKPEEREEVLAKAHDLATKALIVSVRTDKIKGEPYGDGVITSIGTFQKSFAGQNFSNYVKRVIPMSIVKKNKQGIGVYKKIIEIFVYIMLGETKC